MLKICLLLVSNLVYSQVFSDQINVEVIRGYGDYQFIALDGRESLRANSDKIINKRAQRICSKFDKDLFDYKTISKNISVSTGEYGIALNASNEFQKYYVEPFMPCYDCIFEPYVLFESIFCKSR